MRKIIITESQLNKLIEDEAVQTSFLPDYEAGEFEKKEAAKYKKRQQAKKSREKYQAKKAAKNAEHEKEIDKRFIGSLF